MRNLFLIFSSVLLLASCKAQTPLNFTVTYTQPYCGGAKPTPEIIEESSQPKPYANFKLFFVSKKGKIDSAETDDKGILKITLKNGTYKVMEGWRLKKGTPNGQPLSDYKLECLKTQWGKELQLISLVKGKVVTTKTTPQPLKIHLDLLCDYAVPCLEERHIPPMRE